MTIAAVQDKANMGIRHYAERFKELRDEITQLLHKKEHVIEATLCALISGGHLLLEDVPGVGKTTYIKALARMLGLEVSRIQFTSDLLPSDIIGVEVFNNTHNTFEFHKGPVFANIIMADELNRASPRTQSALLEAMGEGFVTVNRKTYCLPKPFVVFASQNPENSIGTYSIPESQLDRFSAKLNLGYPETEREKEIFKESSADPLQDVREQVVGLDDFLHAQQDLEKVHISKEIVEYAKKIVDASRHTEELKLGISTRGGVIWLRMSRARAILNQRDYVTPDDLQALAMPCLTHRVITQGSVKSQQIIQHLLEKVDI